MNKAYRVTGKLCFRNENYDKVSPSVVVVTDTEEKAGELAKKKFEETIEEHDWDVKALRAFSEEERQARYEMDACLHALYDAMEGKVEIEELPEGASDVEYL